MSRPHQDQVIDDDEDETCPLCIEEFDLSDKGFFPCTCGFQICQFCHNKIKTTGNGLCPACRRPYNDKNIKWEAPSVEEAAKFRAQQAKKKAAAKQKEAQNREADTLSRKHLAGIRVRRQNLVYVTGLRLNTSDGQLNEKLRGNQFFGQYGKIDKIVVNRPKDSRSLQPVGVYITYFEKEAAALCIAMVNGSSNAGGTIRADYGTTKYCSAYLRNETCSNRNCTFLHEAGEENESFTREDLSSLNAKSIQSTSQQPPSSSPAQAQSQSSAQAATHFISATTSAASHFMERQDSRDGNASPVDSSDGSALPSTVSWANKNLSSRRPSQVTSLVSPSPMANNTTPVPPVAEVVKTVVIDLRLASETRKASPTTVAEELKLSTPPPIQRHVGSRARSMSPLSKAIRQCLASEDCLKFNFDESILADDPIGRQTLAFIHAFPPLFDVNGGARRRLYQKQEAERQRLETDRQVESQALAAMELDEVIEGGSMQLGGELDELGELDTQQHIIRPPSQTANPNESSAYNNNYISPAQLVQLHGRGMPLQEQQQQQQQQQYLLQQLKSVSPLLQNSGYGSQAGQTGVHGQGGHSRQTSRFSFVNDAATASASIKTGANPKLINQQSSIMPPLHMNSLNALTQHHSGGQFYTSAVQGPPPGLKASGTPPVSGGGMFGQGYGFGTAGPNYTIGINNRNANDEMMRELLRNRGGSAQSGRASDGGRLDLSDPSILQARMHQGGGVGQGIYGTQSQAQGASDDTKSIAMSQHDLLQSLANDTLHRTTPTLPPGLSISMDLSNFTAFELGLSDRQSIPETPVFAGLGVQSVPERVVRSPAAFPKQALEQKLPELTPKNAIVEPTPLNKVLFAPRDIEASDENAFPALPKITPSAIPAAKVAKFPMPPPAGKEIKAIKTVENAGRSNLVESNTASSNEESASKSKRQHPGKLDITAATKILPTEFHPTSSQGVFSKPETPVLAAGDLTATPTINSRPSTPSVALDTLVKRTAQSRTIRVLATPKTELPPLPAIPPTRPSPVPSKQPSRQPSFASINVPGTPASEKISDTVSVTTDSVSRADSPPPSRVGTAPTRNKTKSQLKKERERAKIGAEDKSTADGDTSPVVDTVTQEPIMGRKKKTKKPAAAATGTPTPISRSTSPGPASKAKAVQTVDAPTSLPEQAEQPRTIEPAKSVPPLATQDSLVQPTSTDATKKSMSFPASIIADLQRSGELDPSSLNIFKTPPGLNHRHDFTSADLANVNLPAQLTTEEIARLDAGQPVRHAGLDGRASSRVLITPLRMCLRGLTAEMEERYLELERRVSAQKPPFKYNHRRDPAATTALMVEEILKDLAAALTQPQNTSTTASTPLDNEESASSGNRGAVYGDDALAYLNQFILPPLPPSRGKGGDASTSQSSTSPFSNGIPRTYTTGDPTYSVYGVDIAGANNYVSTGHRADNSTAAPAIMAGLAEKATALSSIGLGGDIGNDPAAIKKALTNAVNGVIAATAAVAGAAGGLAGSAGGFGRLGKVGDVELEEALEASRRECEKLEKRLAGFLKKNRKIAGL